MSLSALKRDTGRASEVLKRVSVDDQALSAQIRRSEKSYENRLAAENYAILDSFVSSGSYKDIEFRPGRLYSARFNPVPGFIKSFGEQSFLLNGWKVRFWGRRGIGDKLDFFVYFVVTKESAHAPDYLEAGIFPKAIVTIAGLGIVGAIGVVFLKEIKDISFPAIFVVGGLAFIGLKAAKVI